MKLRNQVRNFWWAGLTLFLLGCSLPAIPTPTLIPTIPTPTSFPPTTTMIPPTPIPTAIAPTPLPTVNAQVEQACAFAGPILQAIAGQKPDFEDDFSRARQNWHWGFATHGQEGTFVIEDGVARFRMGPSDAFLLHDALNRKDFVLQLDASTAMGNETSLVQVFFHNLDAYSWFNLNLNSELHSWNVDKMWAGQSQRLAGGSGNVSPIGESTQVIIVVRGMRAAIYLNDVPMAYFEDTDFDTVGKTLFMCASTSQTVCKFDDVKFWDLSKVPGLP